VFDGPNILLKLNVDRVNILRDIAIFIFGPFGLKLPIHSDFGEFGGYDAVPLGIRYRRKGVKKQECWGYQRVKILKIILAVLTQYRV